jgi:hypothetical protein
MGLKKVAGAGIEPATRGFSVLFFRGEDGLLGIIFSNKPLD